MYYIVAHLLFSCQGASCRMNPSLRGMNTPENSTAAPHPALQGTSLPAREVTRIRTSMESLAGTPNRVFTSTALCTDRNPLGHRNPLRDHITISGLHTDLTGRCVPIGASLVYQSPGRKSTQNLKPISPPESMVIPPPMEKPISPLESMVMPLPTGIPMSPEVSKSNRLRRRSSPRAYAARCKTHMP